MDDPLPPLNAAEVRVLGALIEKQITTPDYYPLTLNALVNACNQLTNREPVVAFDETTVVRAIDGLRDKRLASLYSGAESRVAKYKHTLNDALLLTPAETALLCVLLLRGPQTVGELRTRTERLFRFDTLPEVEETLQVLATRQPQPLVTKLPRQPGTKESRYLHLLGGTADSPPPGAAAPTSALGMSGSATSASSSSWSAAGTSSVPVFAASSAEFAATSPGSPGSAATSAASTTPTGAPASSTTRSGATVLPTASASNADAERIARLEAALADVQRQLTELQQQFAAFRKQFE